jgi:Fe-S cluster assembly protein SufB
MAAEQDEALEQHINSEYKWGFTTDIESETFKKGLNEEVIKLLSHKKNEPEWLLEYRLKAYRYWLTMKAPDNWAYFQYPKIDFQDVSYYSAPKVKPTLNSLDEVDPELIKTFEKLGISLEEQKRLTGVSSNIAVDAVFDSVSVKTTFRETLSRKRNYFLFIQRSSSRAS